MEATLPLSGDPWRRLSWKGGVGLTVLSFTAFHLAYAFPAFSFLILFYLFGLVQLTRLPTARQAFYFGLVVGYTVFAPRLGFFWTIFGWPALALWTVLAFWLGLFVVLGRLCRLKFGRITAALLIPFVWTGLEYFRSELYYLRFSWLNAGYAFSETPQLLAVTGLGVYGIGWALVAGVSIAGLARGRNRVFAMAVLVLVLGLTVNVLNRTAGKQTGRQVEIAGIQLEYPFEGDIIPALDRLIQREKSAEIVVLSEYSLQRPPSDEIKEWCRRNGRYLVVGGKDFPPDSKFANTVFVINPCGEIVFQQVKCVPIQFFDDGVPAREQKVWNSPWGKIGFCICYDLSYRGVTDPLMKLGAEALIVPSADEAEWGREQHRQHARVAPARAAEHGIPIFRVACTGFSQWVAPDGVVLASASFPGQGEIIRGRLDLQGPGRLPLDHWLGPFAVGVTLLMLIWLSVKSLMGRFSKP